MKNRSKYHVIGLMSGTSLDGLDMAHCTFELTQGSWSYKCNAVRTMVYPAKMLSQLKSATTLSGEELMILDTALGVWYGNRILEFLDENNLEVDFIASHGHTVFHQPERKFTLQIGNGTMINVITGLPVVNNFRAADVALGGQGAPLVPIGDKLLYGDYAFCLNLGGIANISYELNSKRVAYDIGACNMVLNRLANKLGKPFDDNGELARCGKTNETLIKELDNWSYYHKPHPKSLGYEDVSEHIFPIVDMANLSVEDKLASYCEHLSMRIADSIGKHTGKLLATGGGALNGFLIEKIRAYLPHGVELIVPDFETVSFKEAIVFGFLSVLRVRNEVNCLSSVTGASRDSCSGVIYE